MNFNELMSKMRELDQPVGQAPVEACGDPMGMTPSVPSKPDTPPPSMSVNLNAQGMDSIESLLKLMTKVNPDMINQPAPMSMPPISAEPSIINIKPPMSGIGDLGNLDAGPLKMLPDFDKDNDKMPGGEMDKDDSPVADIQKAMGDQDGDGDHDMDDHDAEKDQDDEKEKEAVEPEGEDDDIMGHLNKELKPFDDQQAKDKEQEEASPAGFDQASTSPDPEFKDADYMLNKLAGGLNKPKTMTKHGYQQGDNPMAMTDSDLRSSIRAELMQRLAEAKAK
jgi:hypothetical protein